MKQKWFRVMGNNPPHDYWWRSFLFGTKVQLFLEQKCINGWGFEKQASERWYSDSRTLIFNFGYGFIRVWRD